MACDDILLGLFYIKFSKKFILRFSFEWLNLDL